MCIIDRSSAVEMAFTLRLIICAATGACAAYLSAHSIACSSTRSFDTMSSSTPQSSNVGPRTCSPLITIRLARDAPINLTQSGKACHIRGTPIRISGKDMKQSLAPIRKSMAAAMQAPPPIAAPVQAPIVIWSISRMAWMQCWPARRRWRLTIRGSGCSPGCRSPRSAPEVKCLPAPLKMTTRVIASSRKLNAACSISSICRWFNAFARSGRLKVTVAISPPRSTLICW